MDTAVINYAQTPVKDISKQAFDNIRALIFKVAGINLSDAKKPLVVGRLNKRLRILKLADFDQYYHYLHGKQALENNEMQSFVDLLTTNETYMFREQQHFDFLNQTILPEYMASAKNSGVKVWSAASSSGEEAYSIAISLAEYPGWGNDWSVWGSDISMTMLEQARRGIYTTHRARLVPAHLRNKYLRRGVGLQEGKVAVISSLKQQVHFAQFNLIEGALDQPLFDVIFCRNVLIYFDHNTKQKVIARLTHKLKPGGYLFTGRSESIHALEHGLNTLQPSVYQKPLSG
ncbi:MAG: protein-glutamate O-methyltransferase CheR [Psychrosphaera sp.]|nr:protein-glutamate O-methyltransferase CheR [Psychrosphaera sp.]